MIFLQNCSNDQIVRAKKLTFWQNVPPMSTYFGGEHPLCLSLKYSFLVIVFNVKEQTQTIYNVDNRVQYLVLMHFKGHIHYFAQHIKRTNPPSVGFRGPCPCLGLKVKLLLY